MASLSAGAQGRFSHKAATGGKQLPLPAAAERQPFPPSLRVFAWHAVSIRAACQAARRAQGTHTGEWPRWGRSWLLPPARAWGHQPMRCRAG